MSQYTNIYDNPVIFPIQWKKFIFHEPPTELGCKYLSSGDCAGNTAPLINGFVASSLLCFLSIQPDVSCSAIAWLTAACRYGFNCIQTVF